MFEHRSQANEIRELVFKELNTTAVLYGKPSYMFTVRNGSSLEFCTLWRSIIFMVLYRTCVLWTSFLRMLRVVPKQ